jgi:hypothetical protein
MHTIEVTQADIDAADDQTRFPWSRNLPRPERAIARAIRRQFPASEVGTWSSGVLIDGAEYEWPDEAYDFVHRSAGGRSVAPFTFELSS